MTAGCRPWTPPPSSASGGRSMSFDGRILMYNAGSSYPRMNQPVPTSVWTRQLNNIGIRGCLGQYVP